MCIPGKSWLLLNDPLVYELVDGVGVRDGDTAKVPGLRHRVALMMQARAVIGLAQDTSASGSRIFGHGAWRAHNVVVLDGATRSPPRHLGTRRQHTAPLLLASPLLPGP